VRSFIKEESAKLDTIIKESFSRRKSIKEMFMKNDGNSLTPKFLKDPLI
jgi:hypothetical protein